MRRVSRWTFNGAAALSLLLLVWLAWLCWGTGRGVSIGPIEAWGFQRNAVVAVLGQTGEAWEWQAGDVSIGRNGDLANLFFYVQAPRWLALSAASILPALWVVLRVMRRRGSSGRGFAVEPRAQLTPSRGRA